MEWIVDRIEENVAVLECGDFNFGVELKFLPKGVKEGDVIKLSIDAESTQKKKESAEEKMNRLFSED